ncbi:MAG: hypothetical protein HFF17_05980 [Oscillospiraceae bacterium]|nr:hypothetical protein [Oscillospiraceae bacterium]
MEKEWKIPMRYEGRACGQASLRREGLYLLVVCDGEPVTDQIVRAFLTGDQGQAALGVLVPEGGRLRLRKRIAASQMPAGELTEVRVTGSEDGWTPWEGELEGRQIAGARSRMEGGRQRIAVPFSSQEPFAPMGAALRGTPLMLEGKRYLVLDME